MLVVFVSMSNAKVQLVWIVFPFEAIINLITLLPSCSEQLSPQIYLSNSLCTKSLNEVEFLKIVTLVFAYFFFLNTGLVHLEFWENSFTVIVKIVRTFIFLIHVRNNHHELKTILRKKLGCKGDPLPHRMAVYIYSAVKQAGHMCTHARSSGKR